MNGYRKLIDSSDGKTSEEKVQQILAITPILPGQKKSQPPASNAPAQSQPRQPPPQQVQQQHDSLIDFGDDHPPVPQQQQQTGSPQPHSDETPPGLQQPLEPEGNRIVRRDTNTDEVDEFVDADDTK